MAREKKVSGSLLRAMRKESGLTQKDLATRIGISRETVSAIENEKIEAIRSIGADVISSWYIICRQGASNQTRTKFFSHIMQFLGFTESNLLMMAKNLNKTDIQE
jgi:HTH-type transcriptional regulator/antitoxin HipB